MNAYIFRFAILFLLCGSLSTTLTAQLPSPDTTAYLSAQRYLFTLRNDQDLLPLQGLDTLRPALLSIGMKDDAEFYRTLNAYVPTGRMYWSPQEATYSWPAPLADGTVPNLLIAAISSEAIGARSFPFRAFFADLAVPSVVVIFQEGQMLNVLDNGEGDALLHAIVDNAWSRSLAAQTIFGAVARPEAVTGDLRFTPVDRLSFAPPALVGMNADLLRDSIAAIVNDGLLHAAFPGAQVLVARKGKIVYHETFGYHTEAARRPVQTTDLYDLASVTKITSALPALMRWYGEETFDLDAPLQRYYPPAAGTNKADLTFRAMLSHHARLRPWIPYWQATLRGNGKYPWSKARDPERINDYRFRWRTLRRDSSRRFPVYLADGLWQHRNYRARMLEAVLASPLETTAEYRYSGLLFYLLPDIVSAQAGRPYYQYLEQTFYRPLGAYTLGFNPARQFPLDRIVPTERDSFFRMQLLHGYVHDEGAAMMGGLSANAGLFANAYDLAKLMQMYLNGGTYGGRRYLTEAALDTFTSRHYAAAGNRRGLGFDKPLLEYDAARSSVAEAASDASFGHAGYTGTFVWVDPEEELLFIFLSNRVYPSRKNRGIYTRNIRPRIHSVIYESIMK